VFAPDHEQERLFAEEDPREAALVGRGPALEGDAGGLAVVAEDHGEIKLSRDDAREQPVGLALHDIDLDACPSTDRAQRIGDESGRGGGERAEPDASAPELRRGGQVGAGGVGGLEQALRVVQQEAARPVSARRHAASARTGIRRARARAPRCVAKRPAGIAQRLRGLAERATTRDLAQHERAVQIQTDLLLSCDALLMGRRTFDGFAPVWPTCSGDPYSDHINAMPKYVISTTLKDPEWTNTHVIDGDVVAELTRLKQAPARTSSSTDSGPSPVCCSSMACSTSCGSGCTR
jgi:hypothetical protein